MAFGIAYAIEMGMTIYHVTQETLNAGQVGDFDLPRSLGYFATKKLAERAIANDNKYPDSPTKGEYYTTEDDYIIKPIEVVVN